MIERRIHRRLMPVANRFSSYRAGIALSIGWLLAALLGSMLLWANKSWGWYSPVVPAVLVCLGIVGAISGRLLGWWLSRDLSVVANRVEVRFPELDHRLLTAMEQQPRGGRQQLDYMQESVVREALYHDYQHSWIQTLPFGRLLTAHAMSLVAFLYFAGVLSAWIFWADAQPTFAEAERNDPNATIVNGPLTVTVDPGSTDVERGASLVVTASFAGPLPVDVFLEYRSPQGIELVTMNQSLRDPVFAAKIPNVL
ncbi:MAG: hypothetical protein VB878_11750, partial [Pirellulaceae bacterium]